MTRREFVVGSLATVVAGGRAAERAHDENLVLLLSDCHVAAGGGEDSFPYKRLKACIDRALSMNPLPARAFVFGDMAGTVGPAEDYKMSARQFGRLEAAGVSVSYMMGNHDRRAGFLSVHPECEGKSPVKGKLVQKLVLPMCDFIFLDSLIGKDGSSKIIVAGGIDPEQADWLKQEVAGSGKPVVVCAHHSPQELKFPDKRNLATVLSLCPRVRGFIYGHVHRWATNWQRRFDGDPRFMRVLSLPATGNWGDLGYCLLRLEGEAAHVRLFQDDYCYPQPVMPDKRPASWDLVVADNRNAVCSFDLSGWGKGN